MKKIIFLLGLFIVCSQTNAQSSKTILPGAYQMEQYLPLLQNKRVAIFTNHTAMLGKVHLIDTLVKRGVHIQKLFTPEHGLRGTADAGEKTTDGIDPQTGIKIVSPLGPQ